MKNNSKKHILIVEDSKDIQSLLAQLFEGEGYALSQAYNGQQALDMLRAMPEPPAMILLDLMMPVMDGFAFRHEQEKDPKLAIIPVAVMTADANIQSKSMKIGAAAYVKKPVSDIETLLEVTARLTSRGSPK